MSRITYSRTAGCTVLPGTWDYMRARGDVPDADKLKPALRFAYDIATSDEQAEFKHAALMPLLTPPSFLRFTVATSAKAISSYPGLAPEIEGHLCNGFLLGQTHINVALSLGISLSQLDLELGKFSGPVSMVFLPPNSKIYRSVGLLTGMAKYGCITNRLLASYWEQKCPSDYKDEAAWRAATVVKAEWNGNNGYLEVELSQPVLVLMGMVGMQKVDQNGDVVLPGGAIQFYIPRLSDSDLTLSLAGNSLVDVLKETAFGKGHST